MSGIVTARSAGGGIARWLARLRGAVLLGLLQVCCLVWLAMPASAQPKPKAADTVRVTVDQMHQLEVVKVEICSFRLFKPAIGQIAFNEDASTVVLSPFSGRVTRLIAKIGDEVEAGRSAVRDRQPRGRAGADRPDRRGTGSGEEQGRQLTLAKRVLDRQTGLFAEPRDLAARGRAGARTIMRSAEIRPATAEGTLTAARNRLRVIVGRTEEEVARVERDRMINPLITVNAPIDGTVIARKVGPGQYVRSDAADPLYSIANLSTMWLKANVPENDIPLVRVGQEIEVRVAAVPDRVFKARVIAIGASSDSATRRVVRAIRDRQSRRRAQVGDVRQLQDRHRRRREPRRPSRSRR